MKRLLLIAVTLALVGAVFYVAISFTVAKIEEHPYDNIIQQKTAQEFRASTQNGILRDRESVSILSLSGDQSTRLESIFESYDERWAEFYLAWQKKHPDAGYYIPFSADGESEFVIEINHNARSILTEEQLQVLLQIEYRQLGWDFVFFDDVRQEMHLSNQQLTRIKDLQVEHTHKRMELNRTWKSDREMLQTKLEELSRHYATRFLDTLSSAQQNHRQRLLDLPRQD